MTPQDLKSSGKLLFGERWQTALAKVINVNDLPGRHWLSGQRNVPNGVEIEIIELCAQEKVKRVAGIITDMGMQFEGVDISVYPDGADMTKNRQPGEWTAAYHRKVMTRVVKLLNGCGFNASLKEIASLSKT